MLASIKEFIKNAPLIGIYVRKFNTYRTRVPAGHYYSPIVSVSEIRKREAHIYGAPPQKLEGIDLKEEEQMNLMSELCTKYYTEIPFEKMLWEAPQKSQQVWFVKLLGSNVNLGNIAPSELIPLETIRLGLRGDTFNHFLNAKTKKEWKIDSK